MGRGQNKNKGSVKVVVEEVHLEDIVEEPSPPAHVNSKFKTIPEWLTAICNHDSPDKPIAEFRFNLFESPGEHTLSLIGVNTYEEGNHRSVTRIEFEPTNMYFKLPETKYKNLSREKIQEKLTSQLKEFVNTEQFRSSFLAKANVITISFSRKRIWPE